MALPVAGGPRPLSISGRPAARGLMPPSSSTRRTRSAPHVSSARRNDGAPRERSSTLSVAMFRASFGAMQLACPFFRCVPSPLEACVPARGLSAARSGHHRRRRQKPWTPQPRHSASAAGSLHCLWGCCASHLSAAPQFSSSLSQRRFGTPFPNDHSRRPSDRATIRLSACFQMRVAAMRTRSCPGLQPGPFAECRLATAYPTAPRNQERTPVKQAPPCDMPAEVEP